jgi:SAM-dependent methyltransferase
MSGTGIVNNDTVYVKCNLCGKDETLRICTYGEISIVKCKNCGLIYRNPRLKECLNRDLFVDNYRKDDKEKEESIANARTPLFRKILLILDKRIKAQSKTILDIGCWQGHFLKIAKDSGWKVQGVEVAKSACEYSKERFGIDVINKRLEEANFEKESFDVITLWNVFDFLLDPQNTAREIKHILKSNGILVIRVPNANFHIFLHKIFSIFNLRNKNKNSNDPPIVANYGYSVRTIKKILNRAGFARVEISNSPLTKGDPYKSFKNFNAQFVELLKKSCYFLSICIFYLSFKKFVLGPSIIAYARKS